MTDVNYQQLVDLDVRLAKKGLNILAFPCNQFGGQEPGNNKQIKDFATKKYKAKFQIFDKVDVNGGNTSPVYEFLKKEKGSFLGGNIAWNFGKFLVDKKGNVVKRYAPTVAPLDIEKDILLYLDQ